MAEAPAVPLPDHEDATTRHLVRVAGWAVVLIGGVIGVLLMFDAPVQPARVALNFVAGLVGALALLLARQQRWTQAAHLLVWGVWVSVSLVAARNGGVNGPNLLNYPVIIVLAGWLLGVRATLTLVGLTALLFMGFIWADIQGMFKPLQVANRVAGAVYLAGILVLTAAATLLSRRNYMNRVLEAQHTAANLATSEAALRKLLRAVEQSPESIVITDLHEGIEYVNDAFVQRTGYGRDEVVGGASASFSSNGLAPAQREGLRATLARGENWAGEQVNYRKDGQALIESVVVAPIRQPDGRVSHYVELKQDITERKRAAEEIHRLAHFDSLTSLPNRSTLMERLQVLQGRAARLPALQHALLLLDLDRFTTFNDARGSEMGDRLLCAVALRLSEILPPQGLLVRVAGDEFAVVLHGLGADVSLAGTHALVFAEKLQAALLRPLLLDGDAEEAQLGASVGITLYPQNASDSAHDALRRAGTALHRAKQAGGGRAAFFEQGMGEAAEQRFRVERELRQAVSAGELRLYLQSQVDVQGQLTGAEVLVRWQHPRDGLVPPGMFIPIAEESDLIVSVGGWVLAHSCAVLAQPAFAARRLRLSVNLSARQFRQARFVPQLCALLAASGADPQLLTLEVTEGLVIDDFDDAVAKMRELAALGVDISLDDFGTGYSSLAYLKRLPIQEIKIDRSFVHEAPTNADDGVLVEGILSVARHFGLRVVAEGVETQAQADFLSQRAPDIVYQGYLFGRPEPSEQWLSRLVPAQVEP
ncbi:diguanylate cyclase /diguanylate cyclase/phosphodiesterase [Acidovorax sp. 69]|uniref:putative bifunctional diguanylate cyclase/phosphodiesterase n=1 Tax=Acidovorax sp. 69 TaxID=2035202 RepID=UPI000C23CF2C|nr:bifunctional diguanylate cyclase/phosphodiesterase [Acidovorax sp. 69]PJI98413.1 diguanylate cyclase /diguanylate cyclase/phosphodiesterase [Acidovorax sp. 69]